ncbi:MAG: dihydroneopterin aldolase [Acidimicrobiaceae bacterium]|nr:dihydroneopterin aldolase [Acidimicrobiaceae bacterium]
MSDVIEIRGLRVSAIVGVLPEERDREQPLVIDLDLERPFGASATSDDVASTTNYAVVLALVESIVIEGRFQLLETLAHRAARAVLDFDHDIVWVRLRAHKVRPPVPQDVATLGVSCTLHRDT